MLNSGISSKGNLLNIHEIKLQERSHEQPSSCGVVLIHNVMGENYACNTLGGCNILQH